MEQTTTPKLKRHVSADTWKKVGLGLAIVIVFNLFINVGVYTFYKPPVDSDYCNYNMEPITVKSADECTAAGGSWTGTNVPQAVGATETKPIKAVDGYCDFYKECQERFQTDNSMYNRNVFLVLMIAGTVALVAGLFLKQVNAVSNGFLYGGIVSMFIGTVRFWSDMDDYIRFILLGVVLIILVWLGIKRLNDHGDHETTAPLA